jgi:hypothetical protein
MKKILKKIFAGTLLMTIVTVSGLVTIIFFPEPLFADKLEHGQFTVYTNEQTDEHIGVILDNALAFVKKSELYDPAYRWDVFFSYNSVYNQIDDKILGHGPSARAVDNNIVVKVGVDLKRNLFFPTFYHACEGNLTYLIAHEMMHCLQEHKYGKVKFNPFSPPEMWKLEGYPEYIARQPRRQDVNYNLVAEIERYVKLERELRDIWIAVEETGCKAPKYYYKSRLMIEYLIDVKHQSYDQILNETTSEEEIYAEMLHWKDEVSQN